MRCAYCQCGVGNPTGYKPLDPNERYLLSEAFDFLELKGDERVVCSADCSEDLIYAAYSQQAILGEQSPTDGLK